MDQSLLTGFLAGHTHEEFRALIRENCRFYRANRDFGVYADITPPVALAAYTAAGIAKGDPMETGWIATRNVIVGFIVPFLFVYYPGLVLEGPWAEIAMMVPSTTLSVIALSAFVGNYLYRKCVPWERFALLAAGILLITPGWVTDLMGLCHPGGRIFSGSARTAKDRGAAPAA